MSEDWYYILQITPDQIQKFLGIIVAIFAVIFGNVIGWFFTRRD